jgi:hypothetical protein
MISRAAVCAIDIIRGIRAAASLKLAWLGGS